MMLYRWTLLEKLLPLHPAAAPLNEVVLCNYGSLVFPIFVLTYKYESAFKIKNFE